MAKHHLDQILASGYTAACPADVLAMPAQATLHGCDPLTALALDPDAPAGFGAERPVVRGAQRIYVYTKAGESAAYHTFNLNEHHGQHFSPDREAIALGCAEAELNDFDVTVVGSCLHYMAENSYGFNTTHPNYTEEKWLLPIVEKVKAYHGEAAFQTIDTLVNIIGMVGYDLHDYRNEDVEVPLLQAAQVQSEYHRQVRSY